MTSYLIVFAVVVASAGTSRVQKAHMTTMHIICELVERELYCL